MKQDITGVGRSTVVESPTILPRDEVKDQKPIKPLLDQNLSPPSGANGLVQIAPATDQQNGNVNAMLDARKEIEAPHRRGRTSALKMTGHEQIKKEMGLNARKALRSTVEHGPELKQGYEKFGGAS